MLMRLIRQYLPDWLRPLARTLRRTLNLSVGTAKAKSYEAQLQAERLTFDEQQEIHDLPPIFNYWADTYLRPMFEEYGFSNPDQFYVKYLLEAAQRTGSTHLKFLSVGAGNCDTEVRTTLALKQSGLCNFTIECLELSPPMLARGRVEASEHGVLEHLVFTLSDFNAWQPTQKYDAIMANQSLHHVLKLEHLFDAIKDALLPAGLFMTSDTIGRNGHMRWPEALKVVQQFWQELPQSYRYNRQLRRHEAKYKNWDCSAEGFEGIRSQDVLPELIKRFHFRLFIAASNVVDVFIDRSYGPNFDVNNPRDLDLIDRLHAYDEQALASGALTPTKLIAVMTLMPEHGQFSRNLQPERCVRKA